MRPNEACGSALHDMVVGIAYSCRPERRSSFSETADDEFVCLFKLTPLVDHFVAAKRYGRFCGYRGIWTQCSCVHRSSTYIYTTLLDCKLLSLTILARAMQVAQVGIRDC